MRGDQALAQKLAEMESRIETHDEAIQSLVSAIRQLMAAPEKPPKKIGFQLREKRASTLEPRASFLFFGLGTHGWRPDCKE